MKTWMAVTLTLIVVAVLMALAYLGFLMLTQTRM